MYFVFCRLYPFFTQPPRQCLGPTCQCFLFSVVFIPSSPGHHVSVWVLPVISLLLTNNVLPVRACLIISWERFRRTQKEDERGPLRIQSSLVHILQLRQQCIPYKSMAIYINQLMVRLIGCKIAQVCTYTRWFSGPSCV